MASALSLAKDTYQVRNTITGQVVCSLSETTSASIVSDTISGTHNSKFDLPSYTYYPGIPIYGPLSVSVTGQVLYPIFDDQGYTSQEMCEVDMCNAHAGKGFDYHYHGDPYHHTPGKCLYSPNDYSDTTNGHPPIIGFSLDGFKVYGRHLAETNVGYTTALDDCGGHSHGDYGYHYHAQVKMLSPLTGSTLRNVPSTADYYAPIPGVYKCWRGDIGAQRIFGAQIKFDDRADFEDLKPCTGTNQYWAHSSLKSITGGVATDLAAAFTNIKGTAAWPSASFDFTFTSTYSADQITGSATLQAAIKSSLASALGIDASDITKIVATSVRRQAQREALGLGLGLGLDRLGGLDVDQSSAERQHTSRVTSQSVKITATVSSPYTTSTLAATYSTYSSVFSSAFASSTTNWVPDPTAAPTAAPDTGLSSKNKLIIGVVVGVGGLIVIAGLGFACYSCSGSGSGSGAVNANSKMPIESSHQQPHANGSMEGEGGEESGVEVAMVLTHSDNGAGHHKL